MTSHERQLEEELIEKLRGFLADHQTKILKIDGNHVCLEIVEQQDTRRRLTDRPLTFHVDLRFQEEQIQRDEGSQPSDGPPSGGIVRTRIELSISLRKNRNRRHTNVEQAAMEVLTSFRSYLMAIDEKTAPKGALRKAKQILAHWLTKQ